MTVSGDKMSFEVAITELQSVVERLEAGKVALDESLALYERGMQLVKLCNGYLDDAERRVSAVRVQDGTLVTEPFSEEVAP